MSYKVELIIYTTKKYNNIDWFEIEEAVKKIIGEDTIIQSSGGVCEV